MPDRGQSETLGFVLTFALITASIGLVFATGFTGLNDVREFEQVNNAERAFEVLADNMEDITHRNAPSRSTEIKLADARLRIASAIEIEVNDPDSQFNNTYQLRPVIYDADTGTDLVYVQGAVIRTERSGGLVATEGTFVIDTNRTVFPIIQTRASGSTAAGGTEAVLLRAKQSTTRLAYANDTVGNKIWFNVTSPRATIWRTHILDAYDDADCLAVVGDTVACHVTTDRVYVVVTQVDLSIE